MIGMASMGRPSMGFEAQEQIVARIHSLPTSRFVVDIIKITTGARKMGNTILCPGKLGRIKVTKAVRGYDQSFVPGAKPFTHGRNLLA